MRTSKTLIVIATALALPSCTAYLHEDHGARREYAADHRAPCEHERESHHHAGIIGLAITRAGESRRGPIIIERVIVGSPADDAALRPGDRIRAIDGESTRGMTVAEAAHLIRGRAGSAVELRVDSPEGARLMTLVRARPDGDAHRPCHERKHQECHRHGEGPPAVAPAPPLDDDESLAPELWPPTKPGHTLR